MLNTVSLPSAQQSVSGSQNAGNSGPVAPGAPIQNGGQQFSVFGLSGESDMMAAPGSAPSARVAGAAHRPVTGQCARRLF